MKSKAQLDREINAAMRAGFRGLPFGKGGWFDIAPPESKITEQWNNHRPRRKDMRDPTLPKDEVFACLDRAGKLLGTSSTVAGAMAKAPKGDSYASVRGEYVSTGAHFGLGHGRRMAVRENGRWIIG